ncbi:hypothetical protein BGW38_009270, partial [Lunasporangiospora selenospora]
GQSIDYNINSPIGVHGSIGQPLCKHKVPYTQRAVYKAGEVINTKYSIGAPHGGGHCQWALSYDDGRTWVVIETMIRECFRNVGNTEAYSIPVKIPDNAPSGNATFHWLWNNAVGNRELYSNCADITIQGRNGGSISGVEPLIANYGPNSVLIPEFSGNGNDGREHFAKRKPITINVPANGNGGNGNQPTTTKTTTTTKAPVPTTTTSTRPVGCPTYTPYTVTVTVTRTVTRCPTQTW